MYPYYLCLHLKSSRLCRQLKMQPLPEGFVKVIRHAERYSYLPGGEPQYSRIKVSPYGYNGELLYPYWSLPRVQDLIIRDGK